MIISSGGGLQGFFKLAPDDRLVIDGNVTAQELEAYNVQLEKVFQADACHDVAGSCACRDRQPPEREEAQTGSRACTSKAGRMGRCRRLLHRPIHPGS